jgi:hypothetical protein
LREQIREGVTGFFFRTAKDLAALLRRLMADPSQLGEMRKQIEEEWRETWEEAWERAVPPTLA